MSSGRRSGARWERPSPLFLTWCVGISNLQRLASMPVWSLDQLAKHAWPWVGLQPYPCAAQSVAFQYPLLHSGGPTKRPAVHVLLQDLFKHVKDEFEDPLMQSLGGKPALLLALLMLMCVVRVIDPDIKGLAALVEVLPDELLAILQPVHVARFVHKHFPRAHNADSTDSTQIYAFDEVRMLIATMLLLICASGQTASSLPYPSA